MILASWWSTLCEIRPPRSQNHETEVEIGGTYPLEEFYESHPAIASRKRKVVTSCEGDRYPEPSTSSRAVVESLPLWRVNASSSSARGDQSSKSSQTDAQQSSSPTASTSTSEGVIEGSRVTKIKLQPKEEPYDDSTPGWDGPGA